MKTLGKIEKKEGNTVGKMMLKDIKPDDPDYNKPLDELIEDLGHAEPASRYGDVQIMVEDLTDALQYLKEYRSDKAMWEADRKGYLDWIEQYKEAREKHQQAVIELKKNPPLTWDELRQMEGKPVWVEISEVSFWGYVLETGCAERDVMPRIQILDCAIDRRMNLHKDEIGITWQAYRKERK